MKNNRSFSVKKRLLSFKYAFNGFKTLIKEEHNSRIHFTATLFVCFLGFVLKINRFEWIAILLCIALVIGMESLNSGIENLADFYTSEKYDLIKKAKDISAFAVMFSAIISAVIGLIVFIPYLLDY